MTGWPQEIQTLITSTFGDLNNKAYGQISTVDSNGQPSTRTVHIHCITEPEVLVISCNTKSEKWRDIENNPLVSGCFWTDDRPIQFRFEGKAQLITEKNSRYAELVETMWLRMREEVRITYLLDEMGMPLDIPNPNMNPAQHSKNHGLLLIQPTLWDIFEVSLKEYRLSKRTLYLLKKDQWTSRSVNSLHEK
ncbi:MAG: pyridoxamine 5'-phosphate oxidase family protein [Bdellovibrionota bacterium]